MNRKNLIPLVGIAFAVAVVSTWIFYGLVAGRYEQAAGATARTVVVAKHAMEPGSTISAEDLRSITWAGPGAPESAFALPSQAVGGRLVSGVGENEPLTRGAVEVSEGGAASSVVPVGQRAISLRASDSLGLMPMLAKGSLVDIQSVRQERDGRVIVETKLERVPVLAIQKPGENGIGKGEPAVVTVLVAAGEVDRLAHADADGRIRLALRNPADDAVQTRAMQRTQPGSTIPTAEPSQPALQFNVSLLARPSEAATPGIQPGPAPQGTPLGNWSVVARNGRAAVLDREMEGYHVRVRLRPMASQAGRYRAEVEPEINWPGETATEARRLKSTVGWAAGESVVVRGLSQPDGTPAVMVISAQTLDQR